MTSTDGKSLETLVKLIEGSLIPKGYVIESRERVYNDAGIQIAEFDIVITGKLGSTQLKWLIECRDRPSEGPAPAEWIEQLVGRLQRFNFNKVMAVSSTGFSDGAIEEARRTGIDIRAMHSLTYESVMDWLPFNAPLVINQGIYDSAYLQLTNITPEELENLNTSLEKINPLTQIIFDTTTGETFSIVQFWQAIRNKNPQLFNDLVSNGGSKSLTITDACEEGRYEVRVGSYSASLVQVHFAAHLTSVIPQMPLTEVHDYSVPGGESIATVAKWKGQEGSIITEMTFIGYRKASE
jgi:hypothetical protein